MTRWWRRRRATPVPHLNAVDCNGQRYTTHVGSVEGDWWREAWILTPSCIAQLRRDGLLPLTEVDVES